MILIPAAVSDDEQAISLAVTARERPELPVCTTRGILRVLVLLNKMRAVETSLAT